MLKSIGSAREVILMLIIGLGLAFPGMTPAQSMMGSPQQKPGGMPGPDMHEQGAMGMGPQGMARQQEDKGKKAPVHEGSEVLRRGGPGMESWGPMGPGYGMMGAGPGIGMMGPGMMMGGGFQPGMGMGPGMMSPGMGGMGGGFGMGMRMMGPLMASPQMMGLMMSLRGDMMSLMGQMMQKYGGDQSQETQAKMQQEMMERMGDILVKHGSRLKSTANSSGK